MTSLVKDIGQENEDSLFLIGQPTLDIIFKKIIKWKAVSSEQDAQWADAYFDSPDTDWEWQRDSVWRNIPAFFMNFLSTS